MEIQALRTPAEIRAVEISVIVYATGAQRDTAAIRCVAQALQNGARMVDPIFQSDNYQLARKLLDASVLRQEAIASNIANAETPGYRRLDIAPDFATELRSRLERGGASEIQDLTPKLAEDLHARSVRPDGNSVEVEKEMLEMNRNTVDHEFLTELVSRNIKQLRMAISGHAS